MSWITKYYIHSNIKMIVCGLGGTIIKDLRYLYQPFYNSLQKYGINKSNLPPENYLDIYGMDKFVAIHHVINKVFSREEEATKVLQNIYQDSKDLNYSINNFPIKAEFVNSDISDTLFKLRNNGVKVVFTSSYPKYIGDKIVRDLNLDHYVDNYLFNEDFRFKTNKPSIERIHFLMNQFNILNPKEIIKVGSNINDLVEGNMVSCGVNIAVLTGYDYEDELIEIGADYLLDDLSNIIISENDL